MTPVRADPDEIVDMLVPLQARALDHDHGAALHAALSEHLPWLETEPDAAILPVRTVESAGPAGLLSARTRLVLRLARRRLGAVQALAGAALEVGAHRLQLGVAVPRALVAHTTLHAHKVLLEGEDEPGFSARVGHWLTGLGIAAQVVCGRRSSVTRGGEAQAAISLMLHGLGAADSLTLQTHGIGPGRLDGCGIFVPHKSTAAV